MPALDNTALPRLCEIEQLTIRAVADMLGVSPRTLYDALMHWPIPRSRVAARPRCVDRAFPFDEATLWSARSKTLRFN